MEENNTAAWHSARVPHNARDPGSILTTSAVCTELVRSPHDLCGVFFGSSNFLPHSKDTQDCKLTGLVKLEIVPSACRIVLCAGIAGRRGLSE